MEHFYQSIGENWFSYPNLYSQAVLDAKDGARFVEVGAWRGRSACYMAVEIINSGKKIQFDVVDTWKGSVELMSYSILENDGLYKDFMKNIEPVKNIINPIRLSSLEASRLYADNSLDFIFIDASHEYEDVKADLAAWYPKVKVGGIIAGHDYGTHAGVTTAVNEFFSEKSFDHTREVCFIHKKIN